MKPLLAVLLLAGALEATAQAPSFLSLCHKDTNCAAVKSLWHGQDTIQTGWLEKTFAPDCKCADELLRSHKAKVVRIHLMNGPCMRNRRCGRYEPLWGYNKASGSRAVRTNKSRLIRRFHRVLRVTKERLSKADNLTCYVSPCLECDLNENARRIILNHVSASLPQCIPVDNPHGQSCIKGFVCESHGEHPRTVAPCIADLDGTNGRLIDLKKWVDRTKRCDLAYYWEPWMNCLRGSFVDPRQRNCKYPLSIYKQTKRILCRSFLRQLFGTC